MNSSGDGQPSTYTSSTSSSLLPTGPSYPMVLYIICPVLIIYFGLFVMLRNHYIFKPNILKFLKTTRIKSMLVKQVVTEFLSSLSILTFALSSIVLTANDHAIQLMMQQDMYWAGLCMSVLAYRNIKQEEMLQMKVVMKNGIFLISCYVLIIYQYFSDYSLLLMGMVMMAIYVINMVFKVYEERFVSLIEVLFNSKPL